MKSKTFQTLYWYWFKQKHFKKY